MPTSFSRGPPVWSLCAGLSAYFQSRHSVPYADVGIRDDVVIVCELLLADRAFSVLLDNLPVEELPHLGW